MFDKGFFSDIPFFSVTDVVLVPLFMLLIFVFVFVYKGMVTKRMVDTGNREYNIYKNINIAVIVKILGVFMFAFVYLEIYGGGDTKMYFHSGRAMANVFYESPVDYFEVLFGEASEKSFRTLFTNETGRPLHYLYMEPKTCMVIRLSSPFIILSGGSYLSAALLLGFVTFFANWKFYVMLSEQYPKFSRNLLIPVCLMPSVVFWSSGILKDNFTFMGICLFVYGFYRAFICRPRKWYGIFLLFLGGFLIITIKPYILFGLLPACLVWNYHKRLSSVEEFL